MTAFRKENRRIFFMTLIAMLVSGIFCCNFYFMQRSRKMERERHEQHSMIQNLQQEKELLQKELEKHSENTNYLKSQNKVLDKMIEKQKYRPKKKKVNQERDQNA